MKICHVTSAHSRYDGRIFRKQCVTLANNGYDVTLLCIDDKGNETKDKVNIVSINKKFKNRYERMLKSQKLLKQACLDINADVYQFHDPEVLSLAKYLKNLGKKVIFDSHEDHVASIEDKKWIPKLFKGLFKTIYEYHESSILKKLDYIITASPHIYERIVKTNQNTCVVENFPTLSEIVELKHKANTNTICFGGGVSKQWMHHNIIKALENISNVKYVIAGPIFGNYMDELKCIQGFDKVSYVGKISKQELMSLYEEANVGMALLDYVANVGYHEGSLGNTKIFEYMAAGLPIIATDFRLWKEIIEKEKCGICINPHNILEITEAIKYLLENPEEAQKMGKEGHRLVSEKYNWENIQDKLLEIYKKINKT